uniref:Uncharacterized protein n=1 Tax=Grammatophora oceanica TaxID=210454 RepID=A0A7S1UNH5_9STRA
MTQRISSLEHSVAEKNSRMLTLVTERETMVSDLRRMNRTLVSLTAKVERYEDKESQEKANEAYDKGHRQRSRRSLLSRFGLGAKVEAS